MADLSTPAAALRTLMPVVERAMDAVGYPRPRAWADLQAMADPATAAALDSAQQVAADWTRIRSDLEAVRHRLVSAAGTLPEMWRASAQQATTDHAAALSHNLEVLDGACDQVVAAQARKHQDEETFLIGCVTLLIGSITIVSAAVVTQNIAVIAGAIIAALVALSATFDLMLQRYARDVHAYNQAVQLAGTQCDGLDWHPR